VGRLLERGPASLSETWRGPAPTMSGSETESKSDTKSGQAEDKAAGEKSNLSGEDNNQEAKP